MPMLTRVDEGRFKSVAPLVRNAADGSVFVLVPGGEFEMGDGKDTNCPKHRVQVDAYYIGVYCVTNAQYARFVREGKGRKPDNSTWKDAALSEHPVVSVSWGDAAAYAAWSGCDLPTEAQWEKAARGPKGLIYPWGDDWDAGKCRNDKNSGGGQTCAVWECPAGTSGYGTCNQRGNVSEWCRDWHGDKFYSEPGAAKNPEGPSTGSIRVSRGGYWFGGVAGLFRAARRGRCDPDFRGGSLGFRLVRTVGEEKVVSGLDC